MQQKQPCFKGEVELTGKTIFNYNCPVKSVLVIAEVYITWRLSNSQFCIWQRLKR